MSDNGNPVADVVAFLSNPRYVRVLDGLKEQKGIGEDAFTARVNNLSENLGYETGDFVAGFEQVLRNERVIGKQASFENEMKSHSTLTASKQKLFKQGVELASEMSTSERTVRFSMVIEAGEDGEPVLRARFSGRGSTGTSSGGSRISGWDAYERGVKNGDTFTIERLKDGDGNIVPKRFRDVTKGEDIPARGLNKWITTHYADSHAAGLIASNG